jgi:hypothetical protein
LTPNQITVDLATNPISLTVTPAEIEVGLQTGNVTYNITQTAVNVVFDATNNTGVTIVKGSAVAMSVSGLVLATASATDKICEGIASTDILNGEVGTVIKYGNLTMTDWTDIIGSTDLSINQDYYLSNTDGTLTTTPIGTVISQKIGKAITTNILLISPQISIKV